MGAPAYGQRFVVVPTARYRDALHALSNLPHRRVEGWAVSAGDATGSLCHGLVLDFDAAVAVATAALHGASIVAGTSPDLSAHLVADLGRLGPVLDTVPGSDLNDREHVIIEVLLRGGRLPEAAELAHVSQRTAERLVHGLRTRYHAQSTPELLTLLGPSFG